MSQGKIIGDRYRLGKKIGEGTSGTVWIGEPCDSLGVVANNAKRYAIKALPMATVQQNIDQTKREIAILKGLRHRHVVSLREVLQSVNHVYIVMELVEGGSLANLQLPMHEEAARRVMQQLLQGLLYVHAQGVAHRDLKPANVMIKRYNATGPNGELVQTFSVKLTDFGLANNQKETDMLTTRCGTPHYVAPEIVDGHKYDGKASDVWSCGVLLFYILTGHVPFDDHGLMLEKPNFDGLWHKIRHGTFQMPPTFSSGVQRLLTSMLNIDPGQRATVDDCLNDPWLSGGALTISPTKRAGTTSNPGSPGKMPIVDDDRRRSDMEEVLEGDAILFVGTEIAGFTCSEGPDTPIAGGAGDLEGGPAMDAFGLYHTLRSATNSKLRCTSFYFRLRGEKAPTFTQVAEVAIKRIQAANFDVRGVSLNSSSNSSSGGSSSPPSSPSKTIVLKQHETCFSAVLKMKGMTSILPVSFVLTAIQGLPGAALVQVTQVGRGDTTKEADFNAAMANLGSLLAKQ